MTFCTFPIILTILVYVTAVPDESRLQAKILEPGGKKGGDASNLLLDVFHVVMQQSERGLLEWDASVAMRPHTAVLFRKKYLGSEFLGKRNLGSEFLGKRGVEAAARRGQQKRKNNENDQI